MINRFVNMIRSWTNTLSNNCTGKYIPNNMVNFQGTCITPRVSLYRKSCFIQRSTFVKQTEQTLTPGYWYKFSNQRSFMEELAEKLNIADHEGWYSMTLSKLKQHVPTRLLELYNNSPSLLLSSVFHEYLITQR